MSRRGLFTSLFSPIKKLTEEAVSPDAAVEVAEDSSSNAVKELVAVIQGRFCLAYQRSFCSTCSERCPEQGAIVVKMGIPMVVADACTGCGICHDVCPAPRNAILMMNKS